MFACSFGRIRNNCKWTRENKMVGNRKNDYYKKLFKYENFDIFGGNWFKGMMVFVIIEY